MYLDSSKGEKNMKELLEKIPLEKCWEITSKILWRFISFGGLKIIEVITGKDEGVIAPVLAWDKYEEINEKVFGDGGRQMFLWAKETFSIPVEDAIDASKLVTVVGTLLQGPEFESETVEETSERVVRRATKCVWMERYNDVEVDPALSTCPAGDQAWGEEGLKAVNPKLTYKLTKALPWGDPYCEFVIEFEEE